MKFQRGNPGGPGRPQGSSGGQAKAKFLAHWLKIFEQEGYSILEKLAKEKPADFIRLGILAMPKDVDVNINRFDSWSEEELDSFLMTGTYPDHE